MKKIKLGRREFLINSAAAALAVPAISLLESDPALAQNNAKRFILFTSANGTFHPNFWPGGINNDDGFRLGRLGGNFNKQEVPFANVALPQIVSPFEALKAKMLMTHGVSVRKDAAGEDHGWGRHRAFTGLESNNPNATARSIDVHMANQLGSQLLPIGVQYYDPFSSGRISFQSPGNPTAVIDNPQQIYDRVVGAGIDPNEGQVSTAFLDQASQSLSRLMPRFSQNVRERIEISLDSLSDSAARLTELRSSTCAVPENVNVPPKNPGVGRTFFDTAVCNFNIQMMITALTCNRSSVASFAFGTSASELVYSHLTVNGSRISASHHSLSHQGKDTTNNTTLLAPNWREELTAVCRYQASVIAGFAQALENIPEGNGTMLDNTIILWENELGIGDPHVHRTHPTLIVGGGNFGIRGNRMNSMFDQSPESALYLNAICDRIGVNKIVGNKGSINGGLM